MIECIRKLDNNDFENFKKVFIVIEAESFYEASTGDEYIGEYF